LQYAARHLDPWGPTTLSAAEWNHKAVMELDSALNKWVDALPDFRNYAIQLVVAEIDDFYLVKYNPHQKDNVFAHQSAMLYIVFYWVQIQGLFISKVYNYCLSTCLFHWPFISQPGQKSILMFPSLAICANTARSCVHLLHDHHQRSKIQFPHLMVCSGKPLPKKCWKFWLD
jgi:hypothetical protein